MYVEARWLMGQPLLAETDAIPRPSLVEPSLIEAILAPGKRR